MNNMKFVKILIICWFITLYGCGKNEQIINIEVRNEDANKLALFCFIAANDPSDGYVYLTRTNKIGPPIKWDFNNGSLVFRDTSKNGDRSIYNGVSTALYFDTVKNAQMKLFRNDTLIANIGKSVTGPDGFFRLGKLDPFQAKSTYKLVASAPNFTTIESSQKVPTSVVPTKIYFTGNIYAGKNSDPHRELVIEFQDPSDEANSYEIGLTRADTVSNESSYYFENRDPNSIVDNLLSDRNFDGQTYKWKIGIPKQEDELKYFRGIYIYFKAANREYENFIKSNKLFADAQQNPFVEPFQTITNVKNGFGFFMIFGNESRIFVPY
jgi:Domain of unknown function (DUF4249)